MSSKTNLIVHREFTTWEGERWKKTEVNMSETRNICTRYRYGAIVIPSTSTMSEVLFL